MASRSFRPSKNSYGAETPKKLRAAAYVRVSTQEEQQVGSFDMQILHFRQKIESDPELELVEIYQDEGVSGTSTLKRLGFQRMINDAKEGKIDLILTKSINRFGREYRRYSQQSAYSIQPWAARAHHIWNRGYYLQRRRT